MTRHYYTRKTDRVVGAIWTRIRAVARLGKPFTRLDCGITPRQAVALHNLCRLGELALVTAGKNLGNGKSIPPVWLATDKLRAITRGPGKPCVPHPVKRIPELAHIKSGTREYNTAYHRLARAKKKNL